MIDFLTTEVPFPHVFQPLTWNVGPDDFTPVPQLVLHALFVCIPGGHSLAPKNKKYTDLGQVYGNCFGDQKKRPVVKRQLLEPPPP